MKTAINGIIFDLLTCYLCVTEPRISDLVRGKYNLVGLDHLATMLAGAGRQVDPGERGDFKEVGGLGVQWAGHLSSA